MVGFPRLRDFMPKIQEFGSIILHKAKQGTFVKYCGILVVCKSIYQNYLKAYPKALFVELDLERPFVIYFERTKNEIFEWRKFKMGDIAMWWSFETIKIHEWPCKSKCLQKPTKLHWWHDTLVPWTLSYSPSPSLNIQMNHPSVQLPWWTLCLWPHLSRCKTLVKN